MFITNKETSDINVPTQISPDVWILTTPHSTPARIVKLICPEKAIETTTIRRSLHILRLPMACSATSPNFYIPPEYQTSNLEVNMSLNMANLHMINISALGFHIWQHLGDNRSKIQLQHLTTIPLIPVHKIDQNLINATQHIAPFNTTDETTEDAGMIWTLFLHTGIYVMAMGLLYQQDWDYFVATSFGVDLPD